ncbi:peptidylprolyl isomerase [Rhizomicrobium electricum]|jgi:peptidyl-prolyl cis-trans isomerase A (cyclophilin A)/peptidyl-prolyl cis-trans isomerase B (cyclophilin B)|uniref:Peptidyl-prolyl cis-trans isomerase n=1 Tax=Rhizomicrobium electricum TaxID=480070 RepID=A0ABN1F456_9PROT|nr:peptidylprolyl isomerase [Rhizomicrobium electricum]NIJ49369.1 cyclophilin family peptidyl-prolyl cis-trans isomerase [Rhizomicrobium electricum]
MRLAPALAAAALFATAAVAQPQAKIETSMGTVVVLLEKDKAPKTVANFVRYAKQGLYNNTVIYRIVPGYVIQTGSFGADLKWRPTSNPVPLETAGGLSNKRGTVAMAREMKPTNSAKAEFFFNLADTNAQALDPKPGDAPNTTGFAVFGRVTSGQEVLDAIALVPLGGMKGSFPTAYPMKPIVIKKVTISEAAAAPVTPPAEPVAPAADPAAPATPQ